jgi:hypothetical protein
MDNLDNRMPLQPPAKDLQAQFDDLRHLVVSLLILVIVVSGTLNIYLLRQWKSAKRDLTAIRPQATQMVADYQKVSAPMWSEFVKRLTEYGRTHADFAPILAKYNLRPDSATSSAPATAKSPPAAASKK